MSLWSALLGGGDSDGAEGGGVPWMQTAIFAAAVGCIVFTLQRWRQRATALDAPLRRDDISRQRQALPVKGESGAFRSALLTDTDAPFVDSLYSEVTTLYQVFLRGLEISENKRCLGQRTGPGQPYKFISYAETFRRSQALASAFVGTLGVVPGNATRIGIYSRNCAEWLITCLACLRQSMVTVPLYDTLGSDAAHFIVQQTEMHVIVVEDADKVQKLLTNAEKMPELKHIVVINSTPLDEQLRARASAAAIHLHSYAELLEAGALDHHADVEPRPDDLFIICYTSGTTGVPKGVQLSHRNVVANVSAMLKIIQTFVPSLDNTDEISISYLPLSHMFEQVVHWNMFMLGGAVGYYSGDVRKLTEDMQELRPTIFPTVPRLLNRFHSLVEKILRKPNIFVRTAMSFAYKRKLAAVRSGTVSNTTLYDRFIFKRFQDEIGGAVRLIVTGSAPISGDVLDTCRVAFGAHVLEGYGQTECTAMATLTWPFETETGHTGGPAICTQLKLVDVPDLNYYVSERKGEICIKGPSVTSGYYKEPEKTRELFDSEGYMHTGDVGWLLPNGTLKIIDRKKHIFKLAQGEYVAPEKVENVYTKCSCVAQVYVDGDSLETFLVAVVVPEPSELRSWHKAKTGSDMSLEEICALKDARNFVLGELVSMGKASKLNSIEQVKAVWLEPSPFSVENCLLTPTFKSKRPQLRQHYAQQIADMYRGE